MSEGLLQQDEPPPVLAARADGRSAFVIAIDHASARIPRRLGTLGLSPGDLERHITWDIGALAVAEHVSRALDAPLVASQYSRLVIDCNRDPRVDSSIPRIAEYTEVPANRSLTEVERAARRAALFDPYHEHLSALLDERERAGRRTILVTQHSMTDVFKGSRRPMHAAVLYNRDPRFARLVLETLRSDARLLVGDNQPYFVSDDTDYTIPRHGERRGLAHVEIEIRQDLITDAAGQESWGRRIAHTLQSAERRFLEIYP